MSCFTKTVGKWVIVVNEEEEALMYEFGKRDDFCAGSIEDVILAWIKEALPGYRFPSIVHILCASHCSSIKCMLEAARATTPSDKRGESRALLSILDIEWRDKDADEECAEIDAQMGWNNIATEETEKLDKGQREE